MRRLFSTAIAAALLLSVLASTALAQEEVRFRRYTTDGNLILRQEAYFDTELMKLEYSYDGEHWLPVEGDAAVQPQFLEQILPAI